MSLIKCASAGKPQQKLTPFPFTTGHAYKISDPITHRQLEEHCQKGYQGYCAVLEDQALPANRIPILQEVTSQNQTRIVALVEKDIPLKFLIKTGDSFYIHPEKRLSIPDSKSELVYLDLSDLNPNSSYELLAIELTGSLLDRRSFSSLSINKKTSRIVVASCMDDAYSEVQQAIWPQVAASKPDVIFLIGDNVYADKGIVGEMSESILWSRYIQTWRSIDLYKTKHLIPTIAVWDDHDYGKNDGDRTFGLKEKSTQVFLSFFAQVDPLGSFQRGPGVSSSWRAFGNQFIFLDDRSFRSPNGLESSDQTHFGPQQEEWIVKSLAKAQTPVWLISGDQFWGGYHKFESYQGNHPLSFKKQVGRWKKVAKSPLVFISGDRHLNEIIRVPELKTYEITSSAIHAGVSADIFKRFPSPNQVVGIAGEHSFAILDITKVTSSVLNFNVTVKGKSGQVFYSKSLKVGRP